ncbi:BTB/POZ protein [Rhizophagus clarus]|uniref:BTB/POZ protein n=1 Tax=Rhizophagus clarus TaxID=94130 RepID=A0A8H3QUV1_9GLOM|nr:BTB/POZ protein [Rhizophagus clarus]
MVDKLLLPKLSQNLLEVLNDDEYYDVTIEKNNETLTHIKLPNISPEIFQIILRYIYGGKISLEECDASDIIKILGAANMLELQKYCNDLISKEPDKIFKSPNFSSIPENLLISLIQNDYLQMSEVQIWERVIKWGITQNPELPLDLTNYSKNDFKTLKNTLQQCIPFVRFYNLSSKEFTDQVLPYRKLLPKELYEDLLKTFLNLLDPNSRPKSKSRPRRNWDDQGVETVLYEQTVETAVSKEQADDLATEEPLYESVKTKTFAFNFGSPVVSSFGSSSQSHKIRNPRRSTR